MLHLPLLLESIAATTVAALGLPATTERVERLVSVMGTMLELVVDAPDRPTAIAASERAVRTVEAVEARLSTWREDSELAALNACPVNERFELSPELAMDLTDARHAFVLTGGAFDPAIGSLLRAFDLRGAGRWPSESELEAARVQGGFTALELGSDENGRFYAVRTCAQLILEEGGFGKGVGLDSAIAALSASGATSAVLDFGGQIAAFGRAERYAIAHPRDRTLGVVAVVIDGESLSTSANSERAVEVDGRRLGHILDPRKCEPAADFGSATVFAPDAATADAVSTGCFVLGPDAALELCARIEGIELLVLDSTGPRLRARATQGLHGRLTPLVDDLEIEFFTVPSPSQSADPTGESSKHLTQK